ncbi:MAG: type II secretion system F family protein [Lachnospiraceae bacterium]|nr:type II secretion system F family protein [Lachnospiraceae bacterium]
MNYGKYTFRIGEWALYFVMWAGISGLFAYFFYRSLPAFAVMLLFSPFFLSYMKQKCAKNRRWKLKMQFADALLGLSTALQSGNSIENSFRKTKEEMEKLHGKNSDIAKELGIITKGLDNNLTIEELLNDFAKRSHVEEIEDFADLFAMGKRSGGNLRQVMESCLETISESVEMQRQLRINLSSKQLEFQIMGFVPFGILVYIGTTSAGFFDSLYHNLSGILVMSGCFITYLSAYLWGMRIIEGISET